MSLTVKFDTLRTLAYTSISGSYAAVGNPFTHRARLFIISNTTDGDMFFSTDASNNMIFIPKNTSRIYDLNSNRSLNDTQFVIRIGTQIYVKQSSVPTLGAVYIEVVYALGE